MVRHRVALLLCLLLVLHEFGPAHFAKIKPLGGPSNLDQVVEEPEPEEQEPEADAEQETEEDKTEDENKKEEHEKNHGEKEHENKEHGKASRRGFGSVVKNIIKVAKVGNEIIPKLVTVASIANTVLRAVAGCCVDYPRACEGNEEISQLRTNISVKSDELDNIQLDAKNLQEWTESTSDEFATVLFKLGTIVDTSESLVKEMSPAVQEAINRQTAEIKKLVRKRKESGKELDLLEAQKMYNSAISTALGITIPVITVVIPTIPKLVKFIETKMGLRGSYVLEENIPLKKPAVSNSKALKSWLGKTKAKVDAKLQTFKTKLNTKYGGAVKVMKNIGSGVALVLGYVGSAYGIYNIIASAQGCKEKEKKVLDALRQYRKADLELDGAIAKAKEARQFVQEAWESMRKDLTSPEFIADLEEVKEVILSLATQSRELSTAAEQVQDYIEKAAVVEGHERLYQIIRKLSEGLGSIPFTIDCYKTKVRMANFVLNGCKEGHGSFEGLYSDGLEQVDNDPQTCKSKIGYSHLKKANVRMGLAELATKENFQEDCVLNSETRKSLACNLKNEGYKNSQIVEKIDGVTSKDQVEFLTKECKKTLTPKDLHIVCNLKKQKTPDATIAVAMSLDVKDVEAVQC